MIIDNKKPIFIGGCPRSGTTMLGSILGLAKNCIVTPESHFKQTILFGFNSDLKRNGINKRNLIDKINKNFRFKLWETPTPKIKLPETIKVDEYRRLIYSIVDNYAKKIGCIRWKTWIDHTPQNIQDPLVLMSIFPEAKFIHIVRDPRAVASSVIPLDWGPNNSREAAFFWAQKISYGLTLEIKYPEKCKRFYYEDIIYYPEKSIKSICDFCGIEYHKKMIEGGKIDLPKYTKKQHKLVGQKANLHRISAWQKDLSLRQIYEIETILSDLIDLMGYQKYSKNKEIPFSFLNRLKSRFNPIYSFLKKRRYEIKKKIYGKKL
jgi:hypothetical protein